MNELIFFCSLFFYSAIAIYLLWFICQYNGKTIIYLIQSISPTNNQTRELNNDISLVTVCLVGAMPLAILSVATAGLNTCFNSVSATIILEIVVTIFCLFIPQHVRKQEDFLGINILKKNSQGMDLVAYGCIETCKTKCAPDRFKMEY